MLTFDFLEHLQRFRISPAVKIIASPVVELRDRLICVLQLCALIAAKPTARAQSGRQERHGDGAGEMLLSKGHSRGLFWLQHGRRKARPFA
jgi:hypothetical protein